MTTLTISLPEALRDHIDREVRRNSYGTVSEYMRALIREDQKRQSSERLEEFLLEGLQSETGEMTRKDWDDIRRQVRAPRARRKKK